MKKEVKDTEVKMEVGFVQVYKTQEGNEFFMCAYNTVFETKEACQEARYKNISFELISGSKASRILEFEHEDGKFQIPHLPQETKYGLMCFIGGPALEDALKVSEAPND